jgi:hypothetical protein
VAEPRDLVRFLINDPAGTDPVFTNDEIDGFLEIEGGVVKLAAAQAIDTIADNEALTSKAIRTQDLATDGAKVAESLRKRAAALRSQAAADDAASDDGAYFSIVPINGVSNGPELTGGWL